MAYFIFHIYIGCFEKKCGPFCFSLGIV